MLLRALELKIPPVAVGVVCGTAMWLLRLAVPAGHFEFRGQRGGALALAAAGVAIAALGVVAFRRARTSVNPLSPDAATSLVATGIYRRSRNPMYLGMLLVLTGWALYLRNAAGFIFLPAFMLYMNRFQIAPEERMLAARFGERFRRYQTEVRRWL